MAGYVAYGRGRRIGIAVVVAASVGAVGPLARAATAPDPTFVTPGSYGTVDFGDLVTYRLAGPRCQADSVSVKVTAPSPLSGPPSSPAPDPQEPGTCVGQAQVPAERAVRATGWTEGQAVAISLISDGDQVPLRYERVLAQLAKPAGGSPSVVTPSVVDPRADRGEGAVQMATGDILDLGQVDLTHLDSVSLRVCVTLPKPHVGPSWLELRELTSSGPSVIGRADVGDDYPLGSPQTKSNDGWPNCWELQTFPIDPTTVVARAPELFLALDASASPVQVEYIDFNGTGAKAPDVAPADPAGTEALPFDTAHWSMPGCAVDSGTLRNVPDQQPTDYAPVATGGLVGPAGCQATTTAPLHDVMLRFEMRFDTYADNGDVMVAGHEVQMRPAGEWLVGGLYGNGIDSGECGYLMPNEADPTVNSATGVDCTGGGDPANRLKINSYPDWNEFEIVQLGARRIVNINGRTIADSSNAYGTSDPAPWALTIGSQPQFGYDYQVNVRYDNYQFPSLNDPSGWSNLQWRNVRVYDCQSETDPVCTTDIPSIQG